MIVTFEISEDLFVRVFDENKTLVTLCGPFETTEEAELWGNKCVYRASINTLEYIGTEEEQNND